MFDHEYRSDDITATPKSEDSAELKLFKSRAQSKNFGALD